MPFFKDKKSAAPAPAAPEATEAPTPRKPGGFWGSSTPAQQTQQAVTKPDHRAPTEVGRQTAEAKRLSRPGRRSAQYAPESFVSDDTVGRASNAGRTFLKRFVFDSAPTMMRGAARMMNEIASEGLGTQYRLPVGPSMLEAIGGPNRIVKDEAIDGLLEDWQKWGAEQIKLNPEYAGEFWADTIPTGGADLLAILTASAVGGPMAGAMAGGSLGAEMQYEDAVRHGADEQTRAKALFAGFALGMTDAAPWGKVSGHFVKKLSPKTHLMLTDLSAKMTSKIHNSPAFAQGLVEALEQGTEEAVQEFFQTAGENATAIALYDEHRELFDGAGEAGAAGGVLGLFFGGVRRAARATRMADRNRMKQAAAADAEAEFEQRKRSVRGSVAQQQHAERGRIEASPLDTEKREALRAARQKNLMDRATRGRHRSKMDELKTEIDRIQEKYPEGDEKDALLEEKNNQLMEAQQAWAATFGSRLVDDSPLPPEVRTALPEAQDADPGEVYELMEWSDTLQVDSPIGWRELWKRITSMPAGDIDRAAEVASKVLGRPLPENATKDEKALFIIDQYKSVNRGLRRQQLTPQRAKAEIETRSDEIAEMGTIASVLSGPQLEALQRTLPEAADELATISALREHSTGEARKTPAELRALAIAAGRPDLAAKIDALNIDPELLENPELVNEEDLEAETPADEDMPIDLGLIDGAIPARDIPTDEDAGDASEGGPPRDVEDMSAKALGPRSLTRVMEGDELWNDENLEAAKRVSANMNGREILIQMDAEQFLRLATDALENETPEEFQRKVDELKDLYYDGKPWTDIPKLVTEGVKGKPNVSRVYGHEGRHRAAAAIQLGFSSIPVVLADSHIRWDKTKDRNHRDHIPLPKLLYSQRGDGWNTSHPVNEFNIEDLLRERGVQGTQTQEAPTPAPEPEAAPAPTTEPETATPEPEPAPEQEAAPEKPTRQQEYELEKKTLPQAWLPVNSATMAGELKKIALKGSDLTTEEKEYIEDNGFFGNSEYRGQPILAHMLNNGMDGVRWTNKDGSTGHWFVADLLEEAGDIHLDLDAEKIGDGLSEIFSDNAEDTAAFQKGKKVQSYLVKEANGRRDTPAWRTAIRLVKYARSGVDLLKYVAGQGDPKSHIEKSLRKLNESDQQIARHFMSTLSKEAFLATERAIMQGKLARFPGEVKKKSDARPLWYPIGKGLGGETLYGTSKALAKQYAKKTGQDPEAIVGVELDPQFVIAVGEASMENLSGKSKKFKDNAIYAASYWYTSNPDHPVIKNRRANGEVILKPIEEQANDGPISVDDLLNAVNEVNREAGAVQRTPDEEAKHKVFMDPRFREVEELREEASEMYAEQGEASDAYELRAKAQRLEWDIQQDVLANDSNALKLMRGDVEQMLHTLRSRMDAMQESGKVSNQAWLELSNKIEAHEQAIKQFRLLENQADGLGKQELPEEPAPAEEPVAAEEPAVEAAPAENLAEEAAPETEAPVYDDTATTRRYLNEEKADKARADRTRRRKLLLRTAGLTTDKKRRADVAKSIAHMQKKLAQLKAKLERGLKVAEGYRKGTASAGPGESIVADIRKGLKGNPKDPNSKNRFISLDALKREYKSTKDIPGVWRSMARKDGTVTPEALYEDYYAQRDEYGFTEDWSYSDFLDMVTDQDATKRIFPAAFSSSRFAKHQQMMGDLAEEIYGYEEAIKEAQSEDEATVMRRLKQEAEEAQQELEKLEEEEELATVEEGYRTAEESPAPDDADAPDAESVPLKRGGKLDLDAMLKKNPTEAINELTAIEAEILDAGRQLSQKYAKTGVDVLDVQRKLAATPRAQLDAAERKLADQNREANARRLARQMVSGYTDSATTQGPDGSMSIAGAGVRKFINKFKKKLAKQNLDRGHGFFRSILRQVSYGKLLGAEWHRQQSSAENMTIWEGLINTEVQTHLDAAIETLKESGVAPSILTEALMGDSESMAALPPPVQRRAAIVQDRVQTLADAIFDELENIQDVNTAEEIRAWTAGRMAALAMNTHRYITRAYRADVDNDYRQWMWSDAKEAAELREAAIDALVEKIEGDPTVADQGDEGNREIAFGILKGIAHDMAMPSWTEQIEAKGPISVRNLRRRGAMDERVRKFLGQIDDPKLAVAKTLTAQNNLLGNLRWMRALADYTGPNGEKFATELPNPDAGMVVQLPDSPSYGALAGMWVEPAVAEGFNDHFQDAQAAQRHWIERVMGFKQNPAIRAFKESKTVGNPGTHFRNLMGNIQFADFANNNAFNPRNAWSYAQAVQLLKQFHGTTEGINLSPELEEVIKSGVLGSQFFKDPRIEAAMRDLQADMDTGINMPDATYKAMKAASKARDIATRVYLAEDQIYRVASFLSARKQGKSADEAARWTNKFFPDYGQNPSLVNYGVNSGIANPFIAFSTSLPRIYLNAAMENPVKFVSQIVQTNIILGTMLGMTYIGRDDEDNSFYSDQAKVRRLLPQWAKKSVVFKSGNKLKAINLQNVIPWADIQDIFVDEVDGKFKTKGEMLGGATNRALGGNPLWEALISAGGGKSSSDAMPAQYRTGRLGPFTVVGGDKRRLPESPTAAERAQVFMTHAVDWVTPGAITQLDRIVQSNDPDRFDKYNRPLNPADAAMGLFGGSISEPAWDVNHYFETYEQVRALESRTKIAQSLVDNKNAPWDQLDEQYTSVSRALELYRTNTKEIDEALEAAKRLGGTMTLAGELKRKARGLLGQRKQKERDAEVMLRVLRQRMK